MTKAYLAGFIAGTEGKGWLHNPYNAGNGKEYTLAAQQWREGQTDGFGVYTGCTDKGIEEIK